jgi:dienelactone hydrolase
MDFRVAVLTTILLLVTQASPGAEPRDLPAPPAEIAPFFAAPETYRNDLGDFRSPLKFADGSSVENADAWQKRRREILAAWHDVMGPWPPLVEKPKLEILESEKLEGLVRHKVRIEHAPGRMSSPGYLLVPEGPGPFPAVIHVSYGAESAAGLRLETSPFRERGLELTKRGFVNLTFGGQGDYYPSKEKCQLQPLSYYAYVAANLHTALSQRPEVDPKRIGIYGHSYGGKWAMFASCLNDKFAAAVWSDGGVVFDETISGVNYFEPFYLGYDPATERPRGMVSPERPRTGAYKIMVERGMNLHELHALMAPRPFLVSGGPADKPVRWQALNHSVGVNKMLGFQNRVALTNRKTHAATAESNDQVYAFFQWALGGK